MLGPDRPFRLRALRGAGPEGTAELTSVGLPSDLVGRDTELETLNTILRAAAAGRPALVLLTGEAGIGKTRLADEAVINARARGMRVLRGEADGGLRRPMEVWRGVYRALGNVPAGDPSLPAEERRWEFLESLAEALLEAAPALVVLADLHWADPTAVWVLEHLPRALGRASVALLATSRDHEPDMPALDNLRRVARVIQLGGLDVEAVGRLAAAESPAAAEPIDPIELRARTGGNPLFVQELMRAPGGSGVIGDVLRRSLDRFDTPTRDLLAVAAVAGPAAPLSLLAAACSCTPEQATARFGSAMREGVLDDISPAGVRFHHALFAEAAEQVGDPRALHQRLSVAWREIDGSDGRAQAAWHRLNAIADAGAAADAIEQIRAVAAELVTAGQQTRAAGLLADAHRAGARCADRRELRANIALDLAETLVWLGDLGPALAIYQEAADLARGCPDPVTRARAEVGANLFATAFVPDLPRMRRLEDALSTLPPEELHLRATLLGRLTVVGGADVDATEQVRAWADESVAVARSTGDPVLIARCLLDQTMAPTNRAEIDAVIGAADEVVHLAERSGRSDLALYGHQRRAGHYLNRGEIGVASQALGRAEVLAALLPSPGWRQSTLVQRTTLHAVSGSLPAATASMYEAVRVGTGHIEPVVVLGVEAIHQLMLFDLYGRCEPRTQEVHEITMEMLKDVPSPVFQVQKGFGAQLFGDEASVYDVLNRYGARPELLLRSMTGDHLLRVFSDTVARAGATTYAGPVYRALLPYSGLLNVGGGHSAGLPVDDVLGRLAALDGDIPAALRHARAAVALARSMPSPPLLVHCLDHLADAVDRAGDGDATPLRTEADTLAATAGVLRAGRPPAKSRMPPDPSRSASVYRDGPWWIFVSPLGEVRLNDSVGAGQLVRLLATPFVEVTAVELAGMVATPVAADIGPSLDARAKREYRLRLHALQSEMDDADAARDPVRAEHAHVEMEALLRELRRAVGLGGRDRPTGSDAERARINVARSVRRTISAIARQAPLLGEHLDASVRTGRHCIYLPELPTALTWSASASQK